MHKNQTANVNKSRLHAITSEGAALAVWQVSLPYLRLDLQRPRSGTRDISQNHKIHTNTKCGGGFKRPRKARGQQSGHAITEGARTALARSCMANPAFNASS